MDITDKIKSLRESVGVSYVRPDKAKLQNYIQNFWDLRHPQALEYMKTNRGLNEETLRHFQIGYDLERNAVAIPIFKGSELINFKYRYLSGDNRYTSEHGSETWVFNEDAIRIGTSLGGILIVEGEIDCMSVWQTGVRNVVSPSAGKDSFGPWLEQIDKIKNIYIAYDNDKPGQESADKMADRLGSERCFRVLWPEKDANDFLLRHPQEKIADVVKKAKPFISSQFKTLGEIIKNLRESDNKTYVTRFIPSVNFALGWMAILSGRSNVGKTSFVLNIADEFTSRGVGVLILPYERGIDSVGQRFLGIMKRHSLEDMALYDNSDWDNLNNMAADRPLYFALPDKEHAAEFMLKAKRFYNTEVVIIDHLD